MNNDIKAILKNLWQIMLNIMREGWMWGRMDMVGCEK